ncbi:MAG TPA: hypothetical protein VKV05_02875 [Terriglobales bacterium]|nr:hypothetical protein [Terriglobales bacterium]
MASASGSSSEGLGADEVEDCLGHHLPIHDCIAAPIASISSSHAATAARLHLKALEADNSFQSPPAERSALRREVFFNGLHEVFGIAGIASLDGKLAFWYHTAQARPRRARQMKKFIAGAVLGFLCCWGMSFAGQGVDHNGSYWNKLDGAAKAGYVDGYSDAMQVSVGKLDNLTVAADLFRWKGAKKIIRQLSRELSVGDQSSEQVVQKLNQLYADRKYSELDLGSAVQLLTMRAQTADSSNSASH